MIKVPRRALLLDFDGTLVDSIGAMRQAHADFLSAFGKAATDAEFDSLNGPPLPEVVRLLKETHGLEPSHDELLARYRAIIDARTRELRPFAGAQKLLARLHAEGWVLGIVTSRRRAEIEEWLLLPELGFAIDFVVGGDEVEKGKPDPAPYVLAIARSRCLRERCVAIEDSTSGARSAMAAGIRTVILESAVPSGLEDHTLLARAPTLTAALKWVSKSPVAID